MVFRVERLAQMIWSCSGSSTSARLMDGSTYDVRFLYEIRIMTQYRINCGRLSAIALTYSVVTFAFGYLWSV